MTVAEKERQREEEAVCHDLAKQVSYYLYFFSFSFLSFLIWTYYTRKKCRKVLHDNIACHSHISGCHKVTSHDKYGKVVHRPCSSYISSV